MSKEDLILLPGTLCTESLWKYQIEQLSDVANIQVGDLTQNDTIQGMAESILREAPSEFCLAGLSMGGIVALEIMRQAPERVKRLALLDTNPTPPRSEQIAGWENFIAMANNGRFLEITEKYLLPVLIHPNRQKDDNLVKTIIQMAEDIGPNAMSRQMNALMTRPDVREHLSSIKSPTLVILGDQDELCPIGMHEYLASVIPNAELAVIENCGHLSTMERPKEVTTVLRDWLLS
ncbi:alpha/beta hydrolase [Bacillus sp. ISL-40]|uniref:alpha/beta fold hydrolase n=1 Tax=unclassified Bacillus (in: firmicutes) TaxID=185979 RepID=UPI001BE9F272|nr:MULTISPECIES: alpha/beta hydrolase [unclassified Bacillus (in: firmicutes)]MBT2698550.1 alpha/beta hydrolase [Bacillus sp. ISL-40]MBT2720183.1 alpha/beta hydrolase [Bacillus sp. ISL-46]MBT2739224.1 alpha/beta hydrolase [Bacillus sp. ISL-77]